MIRWFLIFFGCLSIAACAATIDEQSSSEPVSPTIVAPAQIPDVIPDVLTFTDDVELLDVSDWTAADVVAHISSLRERPHTVRTTGVISDVLEIVDSDARITTVGTNPSGTVSLGEFTIRVSGSDEWVSYGHVRSGTLAVQQFSAATNGLDIDELLAEPGLANDPIVQRFATERALYAETAALENIWVPYERDESSIFLASTLDRNTVDDLLDDALASASVADFQVASGTVSVPLGNGTEFEQITIPLDRGPIGFSTSTQWSLTIEPGVVEIDSIGAPQPHDILTRELLLVTTAVEDVCITPLVEATAMVEGGIITCDAPQSVPNPRQPNLDE